MKNSYIFPALFEQDKHGIAILFPVLPGCLPCADIMDEALRNAKEALELHLYGMEIDGEPIPAPSDIQSLAQKPGQRVQLIEADMDEFRKRMREKERK